MIRGAGRGRSEKALLPEAGLAACTALSLGETLPSALGVPPRRRLAIDGRPTATILRGDDLVLQFRRRERFLAVVAWDQYDVVSHAFALLDADGAPIDVVSPPDTPGFVESPAFAPPDGLTFSFFGEGGRWRLRLLETGRVSFALVELGQRPFRFLLRRRFLRLRREAE